ncbi:MAG: ribonuclease HII [Clostridia bacterium]|nr:ribonuclease HII [Clostridia bacterium]
MTLHEFDIQKIKEKNIKALCGVDEAGRGPLAGPVCAAAVILPEDFYMEEINDSKKLTEKKREKLYDVIIENALSYSIKFADVSYIEENNILQATFYAMKQAVEGLKITPDYVLVDGNRTQGIEISTECVIGGDAKSQSIAAASILAKVTRDRYCMDVLDKKYPEYGFSKHKGYGTKLHTEKLKEFGPCPEHRLSFLGKILGDKK